MARLAGGTASQQIAQKSDFANRIGYFKDGVSSIFLSGKNVITGKILPAFDSSINELDSSYKAGWRPYRDPADIDPKTNFAKFSDWFISLRAYNWWGEQGTSFISPSVMQIGQQKNPLYIDPVQECYHYVNNLSKNNDSRYDYLLKAEGNNYEGLPVLLQPSSIFTFINVYSNGNSEDEQGVYTNRIMVLKPSTFSFLELILNKESTRSDATIYDNNWPDFRFGDVTDPNAGMLFSTKSKLDNIVGKTKFSFTGMMFGSACYPNLSLVGGQPWPMTEDILRNRYNICDTDSTLNIPTAQEVLNVIMEDGLIPYEVTARALEGYMDVPSYESRPSVRYPKFNLLAGTPAAPQPAYPQQYAPQQAYQAPGMPQMPPMPQMGALPPAMPPMGMPPVVEEMFWVAIPGNSTPDEISRTQLQKFVDSGFEGKVCSKNNPAGGWVSTGDVGIFPTPSAVAPVSYPSQAPNPSPAGIATSGPVLPPVGGGSVTAPIPQQVPTSPPVGMPPVANTPPAGMPPVANMPPVGMMPPVANTPPAGMPPVANTPPAGMPPVANTPPAGMPPVGMPPVGMPPVGMPPVGMPPVANTPPVANAAPSADIPQEFQSAPTAATPPAGMPPMPTAPPMPSASEAASLAPSSLSPEELAEFVSLNTAMAKGSSEMGAEESRRWLELSNRATPDQLQMKND